MNRIHELRKEFSLTQVDLAKKFRLSQQTISSYENETREPDNETLKRFAEFFNVSIDYLLGNTDVRNPNESKVETTSQQNLDISDLPEEGINQVKEYIELLKLKYNMDEILKKK